MHRLPRLASALLLAGLLHGPASAQAPVRVIVDGDWHTPDDLVIELPLAPEERLRSLRLDGDPQELLGHFRPSPPENGRLRLQLTPPIDLDRLLAPPPDADPGLALRLRIAGPAGEREEIRPLRIAPSEVITETLTIRQAIAPDAHRFTPRIPLRTAGNARLLAILRDGQAYAHRLHEDGDRLIIEGDATEAHPGADGLRLEIIRELTPGGQRHTQALILHPIPLDQIAVDLDLLPVAPVVPEVPLRYCLPSAWNLDLRELTPAGHDSPSLLPQLVSERLASGDHCLLLPPDGPHIGLIDRDGILRLNLVWQHGEQRLVRTLRLHPRPAGAPSAVPAATAPPVTPPPAPDANPRPPSRADRLTPPVAAQAPSLPAPPAPAAAPGDTPHAPSAATRETGAPGTGRPLVGDITQYQYDAEGRRTRITDPLGRSTQIDHDAHGRPQRITHPPASPGGVAPLTRLEHDPRDRLVSVTDPRNLTTTYTHDGLDRLTRLHSPDSGLSHATHDPAGNLVSHTDARGQQQVRSHDALNRLTAIDYPGASDGQTARILFHYETGAHGTDQATRIEEYDRNGVLLVSHTRDHDAHGRLQRETRQQPGSPPASLEWTRAPGGQPSRLVLPSGRQFETDWHHGRPLALHTRLPGGATQTLASAIERHPFGGLRGYTLGNGQRIERHSDERGRIVRIEIDGHAQRLDWDAADRLLGVTDESDPSRQRTHGYDGHDRLIHSSGPGYSQRYRHDINGNRTLRQRETEGTVRTEQSGIDPNSNRIARHVGGGQASTWRYDAAGNLLDDGRRQLEYDSRGRLLAALSGSNSARYRIDAQGRRIRKQIAGGETLDFHYDENGRLISENRADGSPVREIAYLEELPVAVILEGSEVLYIHADLLGSPRALADGSGRIVWRWENDDPYGDNPAEEDPDGDGRRIEFNHRFPGQYLDRETGLHYNYFRDYDPATGRYTTSDPIGLAGGINTYAYVGGNPVSKKDPLGLYAELCTRPFYPMPVPYARHCFVRFNGDDNDTSSFDPTGTHPDPAPDWWPKSCSSTNGNENDDCIKREMQRCQASQYDFTGFNCCHCAEQAMNACGISVPRNNWPNWPVNPGPQPGEPGYRP